MLVVAYSATLLDAIHDESEDFLARRRGSPPNTSAALASNWFFQSVIWSGCTSCCCASSASVLSPQTAASATLALNAAECVRRGLLLIFAPVLASDILALRSSFHPHRTVQFCGASSLDPRTLSLASLQSLSNSARTVCSTQHKLTNAAANNRLGVRTPPRYSSRLFADFGPPRLRSVTHPLPLLCGDFRFDRNTRGATV